MEEDRVEFRRPVSLFQSPSPFSGSTCSGNVPDISPPDGYCGSDGEDLEIELKIARNDAPQESPKRRRRRRVEKRDLVPCPMTGQATAGSVQKCNKEVGYCTPVRSLEETRVEVSLAKLVFCPTDVKQRLPSKEEHTPFEITPWMSCGTAKYAADPRRLHEDGFTHVINMCPAQSLFPADSYSLHGIGLTLVYAQDTHDYPLINNHIGKCITTVQEVRKEKKGRVLLHCLKAVNRSVAMAVALQLFFSENNLGLLEAVQKVSVKKAPVLQNTDFRRQLVHFSRNMQLYANQSHIPFNLSPKSSSPGSSRNSNSGSTPRARRVILMGTPPSKEVEEP
eukprot:TRINITY_DN3731_c0_g1_i1.p1 TRINITY_DN3731_c0_g1~~TRINITY_DN3731_c0_g1_i1.p1  ORF type:complete len:336 (+),score=44.43 TRINITY_DN3731_c0_g1_i1:58-1065(+)